jgi:hypothetical protein
MDILDAVINNSTAQIDAARVDGIVPRASADNAYLDQLAEARTEAQGRKLSIYDTLNSEQTNQVSRAYAAREGRN